MKIECKWCSSSLFSLLIEIFSIQMKSIHWNDNTVRYFLIELLWYSWFSSTWNSTNSNQKESLFFYLMSNLIDCKIVFFTLSFNNFSLHHQKNRLVKFLFYKKENMKINKIINGSLRLIIKIHSWCRFHYLYFHLLWLTL